MDIETVEIVNPAAKSGFTRINKADFVPDMHQIWVPPEVRAAEEATKAAEEAAKAGKGTKG